MIIAHTAFARNNTSKGRYSLNDSNHYLIPNKNFLYEQVLVLLFYIKITHKQRF